MYYVIVTQSKEILTKAQKNGDKILVLKENHTLKNESSEKNKQAIISQFLTSLGIPTNLKGFHYLKYIINRSIDEPGYENKTLTKIVYPECAKAFNTTWQRVERAIRHAIKCGFKKNVNNLFYLELFGDISEEPTNSEFISGFILYLREKLL